MLVLEPMNREQTYRKLAGESTLLQRGQAEPPPPAVRVGQGKFGICLVAVLGACAPEDVTDQAGASETGTDRPAQHSSAMATYADVAIERELNSKDAKTLERAFLKDFLPYIELPGLWLVEGKAQTKPKCVELKGSGCDRSEKETWERYLASWTVMRTLEQYGPDGPQFDPCIAPWADVRARLCPHRLVVLAAPQRPQAAVHETVGTQEISPLDPSVYGHRIETEYLLKVGLVLRNADQVSISDTIDVWEEGGSFTVVRDDGSELGEAVHAWGSGRDQVRDVGALGYSGILKLEAFDSSPAFPSLPAEANEDGSIDTYTLAAIPQQAVAVKENVQNLPLADAPFASLAGFVLDGFVVPQGGGPPSKPADCKDYSNGFLSPGCVADTFTALHCPFLEQQNVCSPFGRGAINGEESHLMADGTACDDGASTCSDPDLPIAWANQGKVANFVQPQDANEDPFYVTDVQFSVGDEINDWYTALGASNADCSDANNQLFDAFRNLSDDAFWKKDSANPDLGLSIPPEWCDGGGGSRARARLQAFPRRANIDHGDCDPVATEGNLSAATPGDLPYNAAYNCIDIVSSSYPGRPKTLATTRVLFIKPINGTIFPDRPWIKMALVQADIAVNGANTSIPNLFYSATVDCGSSTVPMNANWGTSNPAPLESPIYHEMGHALGLLHLPVNQGACAALVGNYRYWMDGRNTVNALEIYAADHPGAVAPPAGLPFDYNAVKFMRLSNLYVAECPNDPGLTPCEVNANGG